MSHLEAGKAALVRGEWARAYDLLVPAASELGDSGLSAADLEAVADAAWWTSRLDESIDWRRRAHARYVGDGQNRRAAYAAWFLYFDHLEKGQEAIASGWLQQARRSLDGEPECVEHGYLALAESGAAAAEGDSDRALEQIERGLEIGRRMGDASLVAMALQNLGRHLIAQGDAVHGVRLLDEAMTEALSGRLGDLFTGWIFCDVLGACLRIADLRRAGEWTEAAVRWCEERKVTKSFHGLCLLYRIQVTTLRGAWDQAEKDADDASAYLGQLHPYLSAEAIYAVGEVRRRRGDLAGAEEAFARAHSFGRDPQPGLALVRLAQGNLEAAVAGLRIPMQHPPDDLMERARLLAASVEISVSAKDGPAAEHGCTELEALMATSDAPLLRATALTARASVMLADEQPREAVTLLREAWATWRELRLPYEAARARVLLGLASRAQGDEERAAMELRAAVEAFESLGAAIDAERAGALLRRPRETRAGLSPRELEVLRLVAEGKTNKQIAAALVLSEHTVVRHVHNVFTKLGVSSRSAATAFAFENGLVER